ncbi:MAG TPA: methylthioribulose 1-phosphate dehydratase [Planktothrix sp.]
MSQLITPQSQLSAADVYPEAVAELIETGRQFHSWKWSLATSSNYSVVVGRDPLQLLMTASGKDKGRLQTEDFVLVDLNGHIVGDTTSGAKPSAETQLHLMAIERFGAGCVLHTHSVLATTLSELFSQAKRIEFTGYEMQKAIEGVTSHDTTLSLPIFDNTQDINALRGVIETVLPDDFAAHGFLIRKHGLYAWGKDLASARRHIEAFEFLLEATASML